MLPQLLLGVWSSTTPETTPAMFLAISHLHTVRSIHTTEINRQADTITDWWEAGAFFASLIDYWYYTGDNTYNTITSQAILHQVRYSYPKMTPNSLS
jgi:rhamnogalacturonyl hydrolase YesR